MKRLPMALCLILMLVFAVSSFAGMTAEKAEMYAKLESAIAAHNSGIALTLEQQELLERSGALFTNNELDNLGGPDEFGYSFICSEENGGPAYEWVDISETGTEISGWSDDVTLGPFEIGFDFPFYGEMYSQVWLCSNGWISFNECDQWEDTWFAWDDIIPTPFDSPNNAIYWYWQDLFPDSEEFGDLAYYGDDGNGNTVFQFEWMNGDAVQAEVILHPDGTIMVQYGAGHNNMIGREGVRVALENADGTIGIMASDAMVPEGWPHAELAVLWELLDMGIIAGTVTDLNTENPIEDAEVGIYREGNLFRTVTTDRNGEYAAIIEIGDYEVMASAFTYFDSDMVPVTVLIDETVTVDIALEQAPGPEIQADPEALVFEAAWMGTDSDVLTISNIGGTDLNFDISIEYIEEEIMAGFVEGNRIRQIRAEYNHPVRGNTIYNGPASDDLGAFPVVPTQARFSELDDPYFLLFQDQTPWNNSHQEFLELMEIPFDVVGSAMFGEQDLDDYTVVMLPSTQGQNYYDNFANNQERFEDWVDHGGWLEFHGCTQGATWTLWDGTQYVHQGDGVNFVVEPEHPLVAGIPADFTGGSANHGWMDNIPEDALVIITDSADRPVLIETRSGRGNMVITTETWEYGVNAGQVAGDVMHNAILYCAEAVGGGWLSLEPNEGTVPPNGENELIATADAAMGELDPGTYEAVITISSDFPNVEAVTVWASLTVLDPGSIAGTVYDEATDEGLPGAEIRVWFEGEEFNSYYCDEFGNYNFPIGAGVHTLTAVADNYYESDAVQVPVIQGVVTDQDFGLDHHIPPEIVVDPENFIWEVPWLGNTSDVMTISNIGGLDLNWGVSIEYIEDEEMAAADVCRRVRENFKRTMPNPGQAAFFDGNTQNFVEYFSTPTQESFCELDDPYFLLVQDDNPWGYTSNVDVLNELEIPFDLINSASLAETDLSDYTVVMCAGLQNNTFHMNLTASYDEIQQYISRGGWFQFCGSLGNTWTLWDGTQSNTNNYSNINTVMEPDHPMLVDLPGTISGNSANHGAIQNYPEDATILMVGDRNEPTLIEYELGRGNVIVTTQTWEFYWVQGAGDAHPGEVLRRACAYSAEYAQSGWLDVEPGSGVIAPDGQEEVTTLIDAAPEELDPGTYEAMITIEAEHPDTDPVTIFATLVVGSPGTIEGVVTDQETNEALAGAHVIIWNDLGEIFRETFTDDNGFYSIFVGGGTWDVSTIMPNYYEGEIVQVVAVVGEITVQNFTLFHHIPATIEVDREVINFFSPEMGSDVELLNVANNGGLPLNFRAAPDYVDDAEMARRVLNTGSMFRQNSNNELDEQGGPDEFGYYFMDSDEIGGPEYDWNDISETGELINIQGGQTFGPFEIPFEFPFYGEEYNEFWLCSNGWISFSPNQGNAGWWNGPLPLMDTPNNAIYYHWADVWVWEESQAYYGINDNGDFVIQTRFVTGIVMQTQIILRSNGAIIIQYGPEHTDPGAWNGVRVAIENQDGSVALVAADQIDNNRMPMAEKAVAFYTDSWYGGWLSSDPFRGTIQVGEDLTLELTADAASMELPEGVYEGMLEISSDHPDTPPTTVWTQYIVGAGGVFGPVPPTGIPYPIIVDEVLLNGRLIGENSGIAVFDGELCVGALTISREWPRSLIAWQTTLDPVLPGFTIGNEMTFKVWTEGMEEPIEAMPTYIQGDGLFGTLPYTHLTLTAAETPTLELPLQGNYFELISTCIVPEDLNAAAVFGDVDDLAIVYMDNGGIFIPPAFNTMGNIILTEGLKVFCFENSHLTIQGEIMDPTTVYDVSGGIWNWVGYPFYYGVPIDIALSGIADDLQIVMTDDGRIWIPEVINSIGNMAPGEGYFMFPTANLDFVYNDGAVAAAGAAGEVFERTEVEGQPAATGLPYAVLVSFDDEALALEPASIEIYDGTLLVGKDLVIDNEVSPVIAWQGDVEHSLAGFTPGNELRIVVRAADGSKLPVIIDGAVPALGEGAYANAAMKVAELPTEFTVEQGYPNPFNPSVTVPFAIPARGEVSFTVYNVLGQQVFHVNNTFDAGFHRFMFDAGRTGNELVSGMYFLKVDFQGKVNTQKLMLLK